jgi:hypothetical protein
LRSAFCFSGLIEEIDIRVKPIPRRPGGTSTQQF